LFPTYNPLHMWQFDWGAFWPILIIVLLIVGYLSRQLEAINRCLLDIEQELKEIRSSALFPDSQKLVNGKHALIARSSNGAPKTH
jgi:hypothetical protein